MQRLPAQRVGAGRRASPAPLCRGRTRLYPRRLVTRLPSLRSSTPAAILAAVLRAAAATAQPAGAPQDAALSREQFERGVAAARAGRWAEARAAFERAYAARASALILFNLAGVQVRTGQLLAGAESYRRFLHEAERDPAAAAYRTVAAQALARIEPRVPHVRVVVRGDARGATLWLDARPQPAAVRGVDVPVDPGAHEAALRQGEAILAAGRCTVAEAAVCEIVLAPVPVPAPAPRVTTPAPARNAPAPPPRRAQPGIAPWLWGAGGLVLLAAGAVTAGVIATNAAAPYTGTIPPGRAEVP